MTITRREALKNAIECVTKCTNEAHKKWRLYDSPLKTPQEIERLKSRYLKLAATLQWLEDQARQGEFKL